MAKMSNSYKILVGEPEGKKPYGRPGSRWNNAIKHDLKETGCQRDSSSSG
jgi:hypothetical protein